jgi:UDP-glucose 4-epimerase
MKKIFVIGANSVIANEAIKTLSKSYEIITGGRKGCDVYCDISKSVEIPAGAEIVINFAATFAEGSDQEFKSTVNTNIEGTINICAGAKTAGVNHLILISSIFALLDDNSPHYNLYSITKKQADELAAYYCKVNKLPLTILRPSQIYGSSSDFARHQPLFYVMLDKAQKGEDILIYGNNDARKNFLNCKDLLEIIKRVADRKVEGIYSYTHPHDVTFSQIARAAQKVFGLGGEVKFLKDKPDVPDNIFKYDAKLYKKIGFSPKVSLEKGIKMVKDYSEGKHIK